MNDDSPSEKWDLVIAPRTGLLELPVMDLWKYRDLLLLLVKRDFVSFYKQTILGPVWFFLQPLFTTVIFVFIFGNLAKISTDGLPPVLFYLTGIVAWNYFSECINKTSTVFKDNANIFGKVYFPRLIMPMSIVISNLVRFVVQFFLLLLVLLYYVLKGDLKWSLSAELIYLPFLVLVMAILGLGFGMIISSLTTKYRDLTFLVTFGVQLLMYATPVIYPLSSSPDNYKMLITLNPMSPVLEGLRLALLGKGEFNFTMFLYSTLFSVGVLIAGIIVFNKVEKNFIDTI